MYLLASLQVKLILVLIFYIENLNNASLKSLADDHTFSITTFYRYISRKYHLVIFLSFRADKEGDKDTSKSLWWSKYCEAARHSQRSAFKDP